MSYSRLAYYQFSALLGDTVAEIMKDEVMPADDKIVARDALQAVGHKIADVFTEDNPKGFDRERFFRDALIDNT
jgi:hypothetical protein